MVFRQLLDPETSTWTYLLADEHTREAVLVDPVLEQFDRDRSLLDELGLTLVHTVETHVHADHVTSGGRFREAVGSRSVVSVHGGAACADLRVDHGDLVRFGRHALQVRATPGHTDGCVSYVDHEGRRVFTGDALLIRGCGRTDFQQGDAHRLWRSVHDQLFSLPDDYAVYPGHDYKGRTVSTVGEEKAFNPRLGGQREEADFVAIMASLNLPEPRKLAEAVPANLACGLPGQAPVPEEPVWAPVRTSPVGVPEIDAAWAAAHREAFRLVDVRQPAELAGPDGRVEGAENVPLADLLDAAAPWDRAAPVALLCRSGGRSAHAANALRSLGFVRVASVRGGILAWPEAARAPERG